MNDLMTSELWDNIRYFKPGSKIDKWGDPYKMSVRLIFGLDNLRDYVGREINIHCGYEVRETGGLHPSGNAVDCHIKGLSLVDQFLVASRFEIFTGIGLYKCWRRQGLHLDNRPKKQALEPSARWICIEQGKYLAFNAGNFKKLF